jgi:hypothetical protein
MTNAASADAEGSPSIDGGVALGFGGLRVRPGDHVGHFFERPSEWLEVAAGFLGEGLQSDDRCMYLIEEGERRDLLLDRLRSSGWEVDQAMADGRLQLHPGLGTPAELEALLASSTKAAEKEGGSGCFRWGGEMSWSLDGMADDRALRVWEEACNADRHDQVVFLCQYPIRQFRGTAILNALQTHPLCIIGRVIHRNPYFREVPAAG